MRTTKITRRPNPALRAQRREHRRTLEDDIVDAVKRAQARQEPPAAPRKPIPPFLSPVGPSATE